MTLQPFWSRRTSARSLSGAVVPGSRRSGIVGVVGASRPRFPSTKLGSRGLDLPGRPGGSAFWRVGTGRRPWPHEAAACSTQVWAANFPIPRPSPPAVNRKRSVSQPGGCVGG